MFHISFRDGSQILLSVIRHCLSFCAERRTEPHGVIVSCEEAASTTKFSSRVERLCVFAYFYVLILPVTAIYASVSLTRRRDAILMFGTCGDRHRAWFSSRGGAYGIASLLRAATNQSRRVFFFEIPFRLNNLRDDDSLFSYDLSAISPGSRRYTTSARLALLFVSYRPLSNLLRDKWCLSLTDRLRSDVNFNFKHFVSLCANGEIVQCLGFISVSPLEIVLRPPKATTKNRSRIRDKESCPTVDTREGRATGNLRRNTLNGRPCLVLHAISLNSARSQL